MNPAALNNAAQALNTAALNPAALLSGKKDQINFYIPKLPRGIVAADEQRFLTDMHLLYFYSKQQKKYNQYSFCILCFLPKTCLPCLASPRLAQIARIVSQDLAVNWADTYIQTISQTKN